MAVNFTRLNKTSNYFYSQMNNRRLLNLANINLSYNEIAHMTLFNFSMLNLIYSKINHELDELSWQQSHRNLTLHSLKIVDGINQHISEINTALRLMPFYGSFIAYRFLKILQYTGQAILPIFYFIDLTNQNYLFESQYPQNTNENYTEDMTYFIQAMKSQLCGFEWNYDLRLLIETTLLDALKYYVNPTLASIGICQNILCFFLLKKDGFIKTFNLLLLAVVMAGSFQQILSINIAEIIEYKMGKDMYIIINEFTCTKRNYKFLQIMKHIFIFIGLWGQHVFSPIFMFITIERVLAVFSPLRLRAIATVKSVSICILIIFIMWLPWISFKIFCLFSFDSLLTLVNSTNFVELAFKRTSICTYNDLERDSAVFIFSKGLPLGIVLAGSVAIATKIKLMLTKRKKLTLAKKKATWSRKTTKTLLMTCSFFGLSEVLIFILAYLGVRFLSHSDTGYKMQAEIVHFSYLLTTCCTFLIFVSTNKKLWKHFVDWKRSFVKSIVSPLKSK